MPEHGITVLRARRFRRMFRQTAGVRKVVMSTTVQPLSGMGIASALPATDCAVFLGLPPEAAAAVKSQEERLFSEGAGGLEGMLTMFLNRAKAGPALVKLRDLVQPDRDGFGILCCMLRAALYTRSKYEQLGIGQDIFKATMECFPRFVREHHASYGRYGFDRDFWTIRQLSLRLFRIGELEFELADQPDDLPSSASGPRVINVHIPSDARLEQERCIHSWKCASRFIQKFFPDWVGLPVMCSSWLLSPALGELLPDTSHILQFQQLFDIVETDPMADDWREWVFQRNQAPIGELPEHTSLQRNMKAYLLKGGQIGVGVGVLNTRAAA